MMALLAVLQQPAREAPTRDHSLLLSGLAQHSPAALIYTSHVQPRTTQQSPTCSHFVVSFVEAIKGEAPVRRSPFVPKQSAPLFADDGVCAVPGQRSSCCRDPVCVERPSATFHLGRQSRRPRRSLLGRNRNRRSGRVAHSVPRGPLDHGHPKGVDRAEVPNCGCFGRSAIT